VQESPTQSPRLLFVLWAPDVGPMYVYEARADAERHQRVLAGVLLAEVEVSERLPRSVQEDIASDEYSIEEITPVDLEPD